MPLVGYNDNIEHRGQTFHVQTEDSGARRPHVITHLFADGGRIVTTTKTSYADQVELDDVADRVRALMVAQHKAMLDALRTGEFDHLLELPAAAEPAPPEPSPAPAKPLPAEAPEAPAPATPSADIGEALEPPPELDLAGALRSVPPKAPPTGEGPPEAPVEEEPVSSPSTGLGPELPDLVSAPPAPVGAEAEAAPAAPRPARQAQPTPPAPVAALADRPVPPRPVPAEPPGPPPPPPLPKAPRPRRKRAPTTEPEVLPPADETTAVDELERAAAEADEDFLREIQPGDEEDAAARSRKPTPIRAGTYSYIAGGQRPPAPRSVARPAPPAAPPRKRRYPQTSPGRRRANSRSAGTQEEGGERSVPQFGARFTTERTLDEVILEFLERHYQP